MQDCKIVKYLTACICTLLVACSSESAEEVYQENDAAAREIYDTQLKAVVDSKCISCHTFHLEGSNRYDNYAKTRSSITQMLSHINADDYTKMPPADAPQLTEGEKDLFQQFFESLSSDTPVKRVSVAWTAYKYPDFSQRSGVSGTFDSISYVLNEDFENPVDILKDATIRLETSSVNVGNEPTRTTNVGIFFAAFTPRIEGVVDSYTSETATISFTMNEIEQQLEFDIDVEADKIILTGKVPDLGLFNWQNGYDRLNEVCGEYHEQKVWPDIDVTAEIALE